MVHIAWNISNHEIDTIHWNFTGGLNHTHNPCLERWEGITCVCTTMSCTIKELILNTHNLTGIIPETIGYLTNLHRLDLSTNQITGELPHTLFHILSLTNLSLEFNHINSTLPSNIGQLTNLTILQLAQNRIHGTLPWELCLLRNMSRLILSYNFLHGTIPTNWSHEFSHITHFDITANYLTGTLPSLWISSFLKVEEFYVGRNNFTGTLPLFTSKTSPNLGFLRLEGNLFSGKIPDEYGYLPVLSGFEVGNNMLTGSLPYSFRNLNRLETFSCSQNNLNGTIEIFFRFKPALATLDIAQNDFTGLMFPQFINYTTGSTLNLWPRLRVIKNYNNKLSGTLPSIKFTKALNYVDFGGNLLTSTIPGWFGQVETLATLYLNYNIKKRRGRCARLIVADSSTRSTNVLVHPSSNFLE